MQLDPSRFLVGFAGFTYDWVITREWKRFFVAMIPTAIALGVVGFVFWGSRRDTRVLANWYLELGNEEIAEWEDSWAPVDSIAETDANESDASSDVSPDKDAESKLGDNKKVEVSPFAELIFRRVQILEPSDRSQYVVGATLAQRGAHAQAEQILTKIAPNEGTSGYAPAHAVLAHMLAPRLQQDPTKYLPIVLRHFEEAAKWERVPIDTLRIAAQLFRVFSAQKGISPADATQANAKALNFLALAAEREPIQNLALAQLAGALGNVKLQERASKSAEEFLTESLKEDPKNVNHRILLAEYYAQQKELDRAEAILFEQVTGMERTPSLARAQSQLYREKFLQSVKIQDGKTSLQIGLLDRAMRLDPTNENIPEVVANLARNGVRSDDSQFEGLVTMLRSFLAEGKATTTTHMLLGESYLLRQNWAKAIEHLEQVVIRLPNQARHLNNLAYAIAEHDAGRLEEALGYSQRSVNAAALQGEPNPDFLDTLSMILGRLGRTSEAIAAIESAIEKNSENPDYHQRAAELYRASDSVEMAQIHENKLAQLKSASTEEASE
ncbi:MAG: tetratricopeptide repeat protein [Planctomycetales bacterium]|nr:tetratricopeptide repeat protein [Planctomycetales bacterium]